MLVAGKDWEKSYLIPIMHTFPQSRVSASVTGFLFLFVIVFNFQFLLCIILSMLFMVFQYEHLGVYLLLSKTSQELAKMQARAS